MRWALVLSPVFVSYIVLARWYTAVPVIDDYQHIFAFALPFYKAPSLAAKLGLIFTTQVGPYKLIFDHALVGLQLLVFGRLDFPVLIFLGNLTPLGILVVLCRNAVGGRRGEERWLVLLLPVSLLLFGLNYAETLDWAISGLQQPMVILFSLAAIHFLVKAESSTWDMTWACGFGVLASMTYANGMIVWPVGLVFLLLQDRRRGRLIGWGSVFVAMLGVYLYRYRPNAASTHVALVKKIVFFVMFCGSALENMHHWPLPYVSVAIGLATLAVFVHAVRKRYDRRSAFFFYSTVWVLLTGIVVANARTAMGLELSLSSRYKIYCDLLLIFCYEYLLDRVLAKYAGVDEGLAVARGRRWIIAAFVGAALVFVAGDFAGAKLLKTRRERAEGAMRRYLESPESASPMFVVEDVPNSAELIEQEKARQELSEAIRLGVYVPPAWLVAQAAGTGKLAVARPEWFAAAEVDAEGRKTYPAEALAGAYRATATWGTILLGDATYVSPFTDFIGGKCGGVIYDTPRKFLGSGRPHVDDESRPYQLLGGTVILGEFCGTAPLQMSDLGVDAGPKVTQQLYRGVKPNGIYLPNPGGFNPKRGTQLKNISVLTNDADGEHSVLIEGEDGALVDGLWIWTTGGTHGLIIKSAHTEVKNFHCKGASSDCLLIKSDYRTDGDGFAVGDRIHDVDIRYLARPGDTGGIGMDAGWDNMSDIVFDQVREDGLKYGFAGGGSWFYKLTGVTIQHWTAQRLAGPCTRFYHRSQVSIGNSNCVDDQRPAAKASLSARFKFFVIEVKQHLRIIWTTACTWCSGIVHKML